MIDLTRLQIFLSIAENLSFSEAAQRLHISQPTVSHHIKALEQALGVELFDRSSHRVKLTGAARLLYPRARRSLHKSNKCTKKDAIYDSDHNNNTFKGTFT